MDESIPVQSKRKTTADYKAALAQMLAEMNRLEERMDNNRAEIERLKIETRVIKARTDENLSRLEAQIDSLSKAV